MATTILSAPQARVYVGGKVIGCVSSISLHDKTCAVDILAPVPKYFLPGIVKGKVVQVCVNEEQRGWMHFALVKKKHLSRKAKKRAAKKQDVFGRPLTRKQIRVSRKADRMFTRKGMWAIHFTSTDMKKLPDGSFSISI